MMGLLSSVIVNNLHVSRPLRGPAKANAKSLIRPDYTAIRYTVTQPMTMTGRDFAIELRPQRWAATVRTFATRGTLDTLPHVIRHSKSAQHAQRSAKLAVLGSTLQLSQSR